MFYLMLFIFLLDFFLFDSVFCIKTILYDEEKKDKEEEVGSRNEPLEHSPNRGVLKL